jgi:hypothetical protein
MSRAAGRGHGPTALLLLSAACWAMPVTAAEMRVQGRVIDVVPMTASAAADHGRTDCHPPQPGPGADLDVLLAWDLRVDCSGSRNQTQRITGYRVFYEWDGRTYEHVMRQPPAGNTISLLVRLD